MKKLLFISFIVTSLFSKAQPADSTARLIGVHIAVGKVISQEEKVKYKLFPEYKDSLFKSAEVFKYNDTTYLICIKTISDQEVRTRIGTSELDKIYDTIEAVEHGSKKQQEYVLSEEEKKEERRQRNRDANRNFWIDFFAQLTIVTLEAILTLAIAN